MFLASLLKSYTWHLVLGLSYPFGTFILALLFFHVHWFYFARLCFANILSISIVHVCFDYPSGAWYGLIPGPNEGTFIKVRRAHNSSRSRSFPFWDLQCCPHRVYAEHLSFFRFVLAVFGPAHRICYFNIADYHWFLAHTGSSKASTWGTPPHISSYSSPDLILGW